MDLIAVAAVAENGIIGADGELPWPSIPADRRQYRERVAEHPVIVGRRTFESMREDLAGKTQIVLSRSVREYDLPTAHHAGGVEEALAIAESLGADRVYVVGGADIYALFQPRVDRMVLSRVHGSYEGDCRYPDWDDEAWTLVDSEEHERFTLEVWERGSDGS